MLQQCLKDLAPSVRQGRLGGFRPSDGAALRCYHKATEVAAYLLEGEMLVKEGGKVLLGVRVWGLGPRREARCCRCRARGCKRLQPYPSTSPSPYPYPYPYP